MTTPHDPTMNRREMIGRVLLPASALALVPGLAGCGGAGDSPTSRGRTPVGPDKRVPTDGAPDLAVARDGEPERLVELAIEALGGMRRFISAGDTVVLKPNIGFNRAPEQAANTNPEVVRAVARLVLEAGARRVTLFDHTLYEPRSCYTRSGIAAAVADLPVEVEYAEDRKFVDVEIGGQLLDVWPLYRTVLDADKVINIPVAKHHSLSQWSMGLKNMMGVIGGKRSSLHQDLPGALADLSAYLRPTLTVLDGWRVLLRNGPQGGSLADVEERRVVAAGVDPVAVDSFGCTLFEVDPRRVHHLRACHERGLGEIDWASLQPRQLTA